MHFDNQQHQHAIDRGLSKMDILYLSEVMRLSGKQIALRFGISHSAARKRIYDARRRRMRSRLLHSEETNRQQVCGT